MLFRLLNILGVASQTANFNSGLVYITARVLGYSHTNAGFLVAQALHESGRFSSDLWKRSFNCFGMRKANVRKQSIKGQTTNLYVTYYNVVQAVYDRYLWDKYNKILPKENKTIAEFIIRLNLLGTFSVLSKCAAWMVKNDPDENGERGTIINVASVAATDGQNGQAAYSASKAGVVGMVRKKINDIFLLLFICLLLIRSLSSFNDRHFQLHVI